jgi:hypothetical protein
MWQWRGIDTIVWDATTRFARRLILSRHGWLRSSRSASPIDHFGCLGLDRYDCLRGQIRSIAIPSAAALQASASAFYWLTTLFWAIPDDGGHLLFAGVLTGYMALAAIIEERVWWITLKQPGDTGVLRCLCRG